MFIEQKRSVLIDINIFLPEFLETEIRRLFGSAGRIQIPSSTSTLNRSYDQSQRAVLTTRVRG